MDNKKISIGFPIMREEENERRAFLPHFIQQLARIGFEIVLEENYGLTLEFTLADYQCAGSAIRSVSRAEAFRQDYVMILRSPHDDEFDLLGRNSCLISMLHFPTRPLRVQVLKEKSIRAISMDSIVNDFNIRLVENMKAVAWNGLETVFGELQEQYPNLVRKDGNPWQVLILGTGMVGRQALDAATKFGRHEWNQEHMRHNGQGVLPRAAGRSITENRQRMLALLRESHIIVDSTQRRDASRPIIPNEWLAECQPEAAIVDLSVDPYTLDATPPVVKGIEGIPQGTLDQYIFNPDDPKWDQSVPQVFPRKIGAKRFPAIPGRYLPQTLHARLWQQLLPLMRGLFTRLRTLSSKAAFRARALPRAPGYFYKHNKIKFF